jgi:hypothetical protein
VPPLQLSFSWCRWLHVRLDDMIVVKRSPAWYGDYITQPYVGWTRQLRSFQLSRSISCPITTKLKIQLSNTHLSPFFDRNRDLWRKERKMQFCHARPVMPCRSKSRTNLAAIHAHSMLGRAARQRLKRPTVILEKGPQS